MIGSFRYLLVCESASRSKENHRYTAREIIDEISVSPDEGYEIFVLMSALTAPGMEGKRVGIRIEFPPLGQNPSQILLVAELKPRAEVGTWAYGQHLSISPSRSGLAMIYAVDIDGAFGASGEVLSIFKFLVNVAQK